MESTYTQYWDGRGEPWEYDPGPPNNRSWARLFAETPNYRGLGLAVLGREKFRWHFGPMHYRGRLGDDDVEVVVIGQEGAQDESLACRSFVGGTGGRMQHFLHHLGITRSYLFLNTFLYPILGQYSGDDIRRLAQHPESPIAQQRNRILDYVLARNDLQLVIAVGTAAKETAATWLAHHGGSASPSELHKADGSVLGPNVRLLGVLHPGGASKGGSLSTIVADFRRAAGQVARWRSDDSGWLPTDPDGVAQPASAYEYRSAPIPFRDLPFGVPWRLGRGGTSSNRKDDQRSIQLFSADGRYNNQGHTVSYASGAGDGTDDGYQADPRDVPYEPPGVAYREYDPGPGSHFARILMGGAPGHAWPDFTALGAVGHPSLGFGAIHRGRPSGAKVVVLADQHGHDDLFLGRALSDDAGQHMQALLAAMGIDRSYLFLRVLPVDTADVGASTVRAMVDHPQVRDVYRHILAEVAAASPDLGVLLAVGPNATRLAEHVVPTGLPVVAMKRHRQRGWLTNWQSALAAVEDLDVASDRTASFSYDGNRVQIPRADLPYGSPLWRGTSGNRGTRGRIGGEASGDYYKLVLPGWVNALGPPPLSAAERRAADVLR